MFEIIGFIASILTIVTSGLAFYQARKAYVQAKGAKGKALEAEAQARLAEAEARRTREEAEAERRRLREEVPIVLRLENDDREWRLPVEVPRALLSRAEIQGLLGVVPMKKKGFYDIAYVATEDFHRMVRRVRNEDTREVVIKITDEEAEQFAVEFTPIAGPSADEAPGEDSST
ncbi:MAG: hypothetical protein AAF933_02560 [Pseudomonadota bacterium]